MLETYSNATIIDCSFTKNQASDCGGAIYGRRRSQIRISYSYFQFNKAWNSRGSVLVQHSLVVISSSTFDKESSVEGYGGSISAEHVGNITIDSCQFMNCTAVHGGSISVRAESILIANISHFDYSFSNSSGGSVYVSKSIVRGYHIKFRQSKSTSGAGIIVSDFSDITIKWFLFKENIAKESGGTVYCKNSKMLYNDGNIKFNLANSMAGAVFSEYCQVTFDNVTFDKNNAGVNSGAIYSESSTMNIHNCIAKDNYAGKNGEFAVITSRSKLKANSLELIDIKSNSLLITDNSEAEFKHVHLSDRNDYCPITVLKKSHMDLVSFYYQHNITGKKQKDLHDIRKSVCVDNSSSVEGNLTGEYLNL